MTAVSVWGEAYIGLGSNLDEPLRQVLSAADEIAQQAQIRKLGLSALYGSAPVGPQDQPDYVNAVMRVATLCTPHELLAVLQQIENQHGRVRNQRWGARTLDLDLLLYAEEIIDTADLQVPHPELIRRAFVLYPLADVAPADLPIPGLGVLADLLAACPFQGLHRIEL
ncbi:MULTISPECIES: 2-amino-4-hydroxy-6-hydroxymethyldihydropteridine diphosphokinase [Methylomonas]|uniref:2-amino-4-hydroxy-6- hydroxymethyldihydropteridine diphosphokinase n=1 Tax=Methylomonas TaxID=416 RepID=UPI001231D81D|nr:2-amino-4-hydroxy-6-hydroxymethyldihydropteridine diphosphokinase [Methylomonas rhizoryzae]